MLLRRNPDETLLFATKHTNWAGPVAMVLGMGISIWLFSNQTKYVGLVPKHVPVGRRPDLRGRVPDHGRGLPGLARHRPNRAGDHGQRLTATGICPDCEMCGVS